MQKRAQAVRWGGTALVWLSLLAGLYWISLASYLLFHSIVEIFTIAVAGGIFMLAWNARRMLHNGMLLFLAIAYLFVAAIDLLHTLAYSGMGIFPGQGPNLPTQLWLAGRYLQSASWLLAPLFLKRRFRPALVAGTYAVVAGLLLGSIFLWGIFPAAYLPGSGLTTFKRVSEVVISLVFLAAIGLLLRNREAFAPAVLRTLAYSVVAQILAELCFTGYSGVYDIVNFSGHLFRLVAYYLVYKAVIQTGLEQPYQLVFWDLKRSEDALRAQAEELKQRNEDLDAFAHTVAHDLQDPLTAVALAAQAAKRLNMPEEERREFLDDIAATAYKMSDIIEALLVMAKTRISDAPREPLDMQPIVDNARRRLAHPIHETQAEIDGPQDWPTAYGYGPWVEEVWVNYLSNALKYGGQPPRIELGAEAQPDGMVRFWVRDHGPGVRSEDQPLLFQPVGMLPRNRDGHGLGLSIARRVVEKLGGQVGVENPTGDGAEFFFTLPGCGG